MIRDRHSEFCVFRQASGLGVTIQDLGCSMATRVQGEEQL